MVDEWKDPQNYAYTAQLDGNGWAWEFLRHNLDYQADYAEVAELRARRDARCGTGGAKAICRFTDQDVWRWASEEELAEAERDWRWWRCLWPGPNGQALICIEDAKRLRWGLAEPLRDPHVMSGSPPRFESLSRLPERPTREDCEWLFYGDDPDEDCPRTMRAFTRPNGVRCDVGLTCADLSQPLTNQHQRARVAEAAQQSELVAAGVLTVDHKGSPSTHPGTLSRLLRVWDGVRDGARKTEVWHILAGAQNFDSPNPTATVDHWFDQASALVAWKYRYLTRAKIVRLADH